MVVVVGDEGGNGLADVDADAGAGHGGGGVGGLQLDVAVDGREDGGVARVYNWRLDVFFFRRYYWFVVCGQEYSL